MFDCVVYCCHYARVWMDLKSTCAQLCAMFVQYTLPISDESGGVESLALLFWGSLPEKFGNPCVKLPSCNLLTVQIQLCTPYTLFWGNINLFFFKCILKCIFKCTITFYTRSAFEFSVCCMNKTKLTSSCHYIDSCEMCIPFEDY